MRPLHSAFRATVSGRVQLVMYRDFACRRARQLGVVGEVQNQPDGTVRVVAEGERAQLERFVTQLRRGPLLADVREVVLEWTEPQGSYTSFTITY